MMQVSRFFRALRKAERFQNKLYSKYSTVRLIKSPMFEESGVYVWYVSNS